jgi:hypothetical protein
VVQAALKSFCDELIRRVPGHIEPILLGRKNEVGKQDLEQDPEQFVNQYLVWPVCESVNLDYISEWYHEGHGGSIDLYIRNTKQPVFGECKRLNHYKLAIKDLREYLNHRTARTQFGVATDGINWLFIRDPGDLRKNVEVLEYHSFRGALFDYLTSISAVRPQLQGKRVLWNSSVAKVAKAPYQQYGKLHRESIEESTQIFAEKFSPDNLSTYSDRQEYDEPITSFGDCSKNHSDTTLDDFN